MKHGSSWEKLCARPLWGPGVFVLAHAPEKILGLEKRELQGAL